MAQGKAGDQAMAMEQEGAEEEVVEVIQEEGVAVGLIRTRYLLEP